MAQQGAQFTIRSLIIGVALVGLNLGAAVATWRRVHGPAIQPPAPRATSGPRVWNYAAPDPDGPVQLSPVTLADGQTLERIVRPMPRPGPILVLSPMIAGVAITLLVVLVPWRSLVRSAENDRRFVIEEQLSQPAGRHRTVRVAVITVSLLALILVSAVYRPDPFSTVEGLDRSWPPLGHSVPLRISLEGSRWLIYWSDSRVVPVDPDDPDSRILETILCKPDGSVVLYEGSPGLLERLFTWPREVVKDPTWSPLEMWWPMLGTAAIGFLAVKALWHNARHRRDDSTFWFGDEAVPGEPERCLA